MLENIQAHICSCFSLMKTNICMRQAHVRCPKFKGDNLKNILHMVNLRNRNVRLICVLLRIETKDSHLINQDTNILFKLIYSNYLFTFRHQFSKATCGSKTNAVLFFFRNIKKQWIFTLCLFPCFGNEDEAAAAADHGICCTALFFPTLVLQCHLCSFLSQ